MNLSLGVITVHLHAARLLDSFEFNPFIAMLKPQSNGPSY